MILKGKTGTFMSALRLLHEDKTGGEVPWTSVVTLHDDSSQVCFEGNPCSCVLVNQKQI